jgi:hypothetical protein
MTASRAMVTIAISLMLAALVLTAETIGSHETDASPAAAQQHGIFTGEYANGVPVYRLPALVVIAERNGLPPKTARGENLERARQVRSKVAPGPPA